MRSLSVLSASLVLAVAATAQSSLMTATDYGVTAKAGTRSDSRSAPKGTKVTRFLFVRASAGFSAYASSSARPSRSLSAGDGLFVTESARASSRDAKGSAVAGTTTSKGSPAGNAHAMVWSAPVASGKKGKVTVSWGARGSSSGAAVSAKVSVNGKVLATFTLRDKPVRKVFDVVAGPKGISITVETSGKAEVKGRGSAFYLASVGAWFRTGDTSGKCTFTKAGQPCNGGGDLSGSAKAGSRVHWITAKVTKARARSLGVLLVGRKLTRAIKLPFGGCELGVVGIPLPLFSSSTGEAHRSFPVPAGRDLAFSMQAGFVGRDSKGFQIGTSNRLDVKCTK